VGDTALKHTADCAVLNEELWTGEESEENECMVRGLHPDVHMDIR